MKIDDITQVSLLYDFYGQLLTNRQRDTMELYYGENLSLAEIAEEFNISRQGVSDSLKNGVKALNEYESKLGLVNKLQSTNHAISKIDEIIDNIIARLSNYEAGNSTEQTVKELRTVKDIIDKLED